MAGTDREQLRSEHDQWVVGLDFGAALAELTHRGADTIVMKFLPEKQDNDKNQIYLGTDLTGAASLIPSVNLRGERTSSRKQGAPGKTLFQADVDFWWITRDGGESPAPNAKVIFYPQYPEVRLSGLILGSPNPPRTLYVKKLGAQVAGRVLMLGTTPAGRTYGLLLPPESAAASSLAEAAPAMERYGVLHLSLVDGDVALSREGIAAELHGVHLRGWVPGCRLTLDGVKPYWTRPAGGATFEAQFGVVTNSKAEPDFQGWELKQHAQNVITLLTSEPDGGLYAADFPGFMRLYGVEKPDRHDFTGIQRHGAGPHKVNGLRLRLRGYEPNGEYDPDGAIELVDIDGNVAASWSFLKLLDHWRAKHAKVSFVKSEKNDVVKSYRFGKDVLLAEGASFNRLIDSIAAGTVYYDPGSHVSFDEQGRPVPGSGKKRNQWRVHVRHLDVLYATVTPLDVTTVPADNTISQRALDALGVVLPVLPEQPD